ncbi:MAG: ribonuclease HI family protein [Anaerolineales bacterium]
MAASRPVVLTFDGGSLGNPGRAYGSFRLTPPRGKALPPKRLEFGHGTNNQAEYQALIAGLEAVLLWAVKSGHDPRVTQVELRGDSQLVLNQLSGEWKVKDPHLRRLHSRARSLIDQFGRVEFVHQPRAITVRVLGH